MNGIKIGVLVMSTSPLTPTVSGRCLGQRVAEKSFLFGRARSHRPTSRHISAETRELRRLHQAPTLAGVSVGTTFVAACTNSGARAETRKTGNSYEGLELALP